VRRLTAVFLFNYSERSDGTPRRVPLARAAWRALAAAADRGEFCAIDAVWRGWLRHPRDDRRELVNRWREPARVEQALLRAAVELARPAPEREAIGAFCARHDIAPAEDAERARFYLLTGQWAQHRAADPDGTALAAAYQAAPETVRAALRKAMADSGDLDLVRVVAARGDGRGAAPATAEECAYLAAELARRREWDRLWRLALDFPLADAAAAARVLPADWRPADEAGRRLLKHLVAVSPAKITAMAAPAVFRPDVGESVTRLNCHFAQDDSEMAVTRWLRRTKPASSNGFHRQPPIVFTLPGRHRRDLPASIGWEPVKNTPSLACDTVHLLHFGPGVVFTGSGSPVGSWNKPARLIRQPTRGFGAKPMEYIGTSAGFVRLAPVRDGFVVAEDGRLLHGTAVPRSPLRDVTPPGLRLDGDGDAITCVAGEPGGGLVALGIQHAARGRDELLILGPDFEIINRVAVRAGDGRRIRWVGFPRPDALITGHRSENYEQPQEFRSWKLGPPTKLEATARCGSIWSQIQLLRSAGLVVFDSGRTFLDAATLQPAAPPLSLAWLPNRSDEHLVLSPGGGYAARWRSAEIPYGTPWDTMTRVDKSFRYSRDLEVRDLRQEAVADVLRRPLARARPADLAAIRQVSDHLAARGQVPEPVSLLLACLEHRFGAEVAIGGTQSLATATDDIAL
jgi:hypothetical protein